MVRTPAAVFAAVGPSPTARYARGRQSFTAVAHNGLVRIHSDHKPPRSLSPQQAVDLMEAFADLARDRPTGTRKPLGAASPDPQALKRFLREFGQVILHAHRQGSPWDAAAVAAARARAPVSSGRMGGAVLVGAGLVGAGLVGAGPAVAAGPPALYVPPSYASAP